MARSAGSPPLTAVLQSTPDTVDLLRDQLYAIAALGAPGARALVCVGGDVEHRSSVQELGSRLTGLAAVDVVTAGASTCPTAPTAFNAGLDSVTTPYCCFLRPCELLYPRFSGLLVGALESHPDRAGVFAGGRFVRGRRLADGYAADAKTTWHAQAQDADAIAERPSVALCATALRVAALRDGGLRFTEETGDATGWSVLRALGSGALLAVDAVVCERRTLTR